MSESSATPESVPQDLLEILVCPETRQPVRLAEAAELERLNARIRAGEVRNRGGEKVTEPLREALIREDGRLLYPVDDGIPVMLVDESIELGA
ncbi:MAG: Trm112 family protein [Myxococcota bacterium]|nr:Trm112 family protein [Myxococcota bacterium]